jgi:hypothetical protein
VSSPLAMGLGYHTMAAPFDPVVDLSGLLWFVHTDDSVITGGKISAIDDRVGPYSFAQSNSANRPLENTSEFAGHTVWEFSNTGRRYLFLNDATLAGTLNGAPACTMGAYINIVDQGTANDACAHTSDVASYSHSVRHGHNTTRHRFIESAGGLTQYQSANGTFPSTSGWQLWCAVSDGAGNIEWFLDGVSAATASGTHQSPAALDNVVLGEAINNAVATKEVYIGGLFACTGQLNAATQVALKDWFDGSFA